MAGVVVDVSPAGVVDDIPKAEKGVLSSCSQAVPRSCVVGDGEDETELLVSLQQGCVGLGVSAGVPQDADLVKGVHGGADRRLIEGGQRVTRCCSIRASAWAGWLLVFGTLRLPSSSDSTATPAVNSASVRAGSTSRLDRSNAGLSTKGLATTSPEVTSRKLRARTSARGSR